MKEKKIYYRELDFIRIVFFLAIFLYHLNILKGGYLAVCSFFVLSGYLSCVSAFKKKKFSLYSYYKNRLLQIYLPLILVVFMTIAVTSLLKNINWLSLKPETTSVLLGYNNFWQLNANLDYFARHIDSPFMHLWYISILLQFELLFPFLYLILKKIGDKVHKIIPCLMMFILSIGGTVYFYFASTNQSIMISYYSTFARIFSLLFGVFLGFIHSYYKPFIIKKIKQTIWSKIIFCFYLIALVLLFCFIGADSPYFNLSMILTTILTCRIIDYSTIDTKEKLSKKDKFIKSFSQIGYEVYLLQYPIIFLFQYINIPESWKLCSIIILVFLLSYLLHFVLSTKKSFKPLRYLFRIIIIMISLFGIYQYYLTEDHTLEMKQLENQLEKNELEMQKKQEEYEKKLKQEQEKLEKMLLELEQNESKLQEVVKELPLVGIGDSVMLGAVPNLYESFPNGYFDAKVSRTAWAVGTIIRDLKAKNMLGNPVVLNLGANGDCPENIKIEILKACEEREVFWVNVTNDSDVNVNEKLLKFANKYDNLHVIDWNTISKGHSEYFYADGIHLTTTGRDAYVKAISDAIYNVYLEKYKKQKEELLHKHEEEQKDNVTFYGNTLLLNAFDYIQEKNPDAKFMMNKDYNSITLKEEIEKGLKENTLTNKIVFIFDKTVELDQKKYLELIELCKKKKIYIAVVDEKTEKELSKLKEANVTVLDFYQEIKKHPDYLMVDKIHLTQTGNKTFSEFLFKAIQ